MANDKKSKSNIFGTLKASVLMIVIMLVMLAIFSINSKKTAKSSVESTLISVVNQCATGVQNQIDGMTKTAIPFAAYIEYVEDCTEKDLREICAILQFNSAADGVLICSESGTGCWDTGEMYMPEEMPYLDQIFSSDDDHVFQIELEDGKQYVVSCVPFTVNDEQSFIVMYYDLGHFYQIAKPYLSEMDAFAVLINQDGRILAATNSDSNFIKQSNLFDFNANDKTIKSFIMRIRSRSTASVNAKYGGEERVLIAVPMGAGEMDVIVGFRQEYVDKRISLFNKNAKTILWELVIVIAIFMGFMIGDAVINNIRHKESKKNLEEKADTDLLTGLNNKLATERKIKEYIEEFPNDQCMMILIDLDNFKKINDTMGHAFGDEVLRSLGKQISGVFRVSDILGRIGGDEFMVFLKGMNSKEDVQRQAAKISNFFKDFQAGTYVKYSETASMGVSLYPQNAKSFEDLYKAADKALYKAKKNGKNQLAFYDDAEKDESDQETPDDPQE